MNLIELNYNLPISGYWRHQRHKLKEKKTRGKWQCFQSRIELRNLERDDSTLYTLAWLTAWLSGLLLFGFFILNFDWMKNIIHFY